MTQMWKMQSQKEVRRNETQKLNMFTLDEIAGKRYHTDGFSVNVTSH